jgi:hypothetical protein
MEFDLNHPGFITIAEEAITLLKRLSDDYPHLVSPSVEEAIDNWEKRITSRMEAERAKAEIARAEEEALARLAADLIQTHQMEDVLQMLSDEYSITIDYRRLIDLIGKERYIDALQREATLLKNNSISPEQMAELWNSMGKPALGDERWAADDITSILQPVAE